MRRLLGLLLCGRAAALFGFRLPWGDRNRDRNYRPRPPAYLRKRNATVTSPAPPPVTQYTAAEEQTVLPQLRKALSAVSKELQSLVAYYQWRRRRPGADQAEQTAEQRPATKRKPRRGPRWQQPVRYRCYRRRHKCLEDGGLAPRAAETISGRIRAVRGTHVHSVVARRAVGRRRVLLGSSCWETTSTS